VFFDCLQDPIHEMFPIITGAPDLGDEDDALLMQFDDPVLPTDNEVRKICKHLDCEDVHTKQDLICS
jgi:hypothetical protein